MIPVVPTSGMVGLAVAVVIVAVVVTVIEALEIVRVQFELVLLMNIVDDLQFAYQVVGVRLVWPRFALWLPLSHEFGHKSKVEAAIVISN